MIVLFLLFLRNSDWHCDVYLSLTWGIWAACDWRVPDFQPAVASWYSSCTDRGLSRTCTGKRIFLWGGKKLRKKNLFSIWAQCRAGYSGTDKDYTCTDVAGSETWVPVESAIVCESSKLIFVFHCFWGVFSDKKYSPKEFWEFFQLLTNILRIKKVVN